jgi:tripartite-type tricarboxylate transporter receptor subunit TctC
MGLNKAFLIDLRHTLFSLLLETIRGTMNTVLYCKRLFPLAPARVLVLVLALALTAWAGLGVMALPVPSLAQSPNSAMGRIIVPFAAGGAREMPARAIYQEMAQALGEHWIIESHQGAGGAIGTVFVAKAEPDGKTLLMAASSHFVTAALGSKPHYDAVKDFVPVGNIGTQSYVLLISAKLPFKTVADFIAYAKKHPGEMNYNSAGIGSSTHLAMAYFCRQAGIELLHIPYKGTQEAANDVVAGRSQAVIVPTAGVGVYLSDPRIKALAITSHHRAALHPNIPTVDESGLKDFYFESWFGLLAPSGTPKASVQRINSALNQAISQDVVRQRLLSQGIEPSHDSAEEFEKVFLADKALMTRLVQEVGLKAE